MRNTPSDARIHLLLEIIDQAYERHAWHGTNLRGSIRGITPEVASWRPSSGRHNIWEIIVHVAYWKYIVRRRLLGERRGSFPLKGSNWFQRPHATGPSSPMEDISLLDETHKSMREAIANISPARLKRTSATGKYTNAALIYGIASHDLYHAGQIQLLKRLQKG